MQPTLQEALAKLARTDFRADPIGGVKYSRATSIISSAYKRHGQILGKALLERLNECGRFNVWTENNFKLSLLSKLELQKEFPPINYREINLSYGEQDQTIPIDLIVYDADSKKMCSYNVKRGNGAYDAGKKRLIFGELIRTQMQLKSYGEEIGFNVKTAEAYTIFYYGLRSIPEPYSLVGEQLDNHFQFPVYSAIEAVNDLFRAGLYELIEGPASLGS